MYANTKWNGQAGVHVKFKDILKILSPYKKYAVIICVLMAATSGVSFLSPFVSRILLDEGLIAVRFAVVLRCAIVLLVISVLRSGITYVQGRVEIVLSDLLELEWKQKAFSHSLRLKPSYYHDRTFYKTVHDAMYDVDNILTITDNVFLTCLVTLFQIAGVTAALFFIQWRMALFLLCLIPIRIWVNTMVSARVQKASQETVEKHKAYHKWFENILAGIIDIKLWGLYDKTTDAYHEQMSQLMRAQRRMMLLQKQDTALSTVLQQLFVSLLYVLGGWLLMRGTLAGFTAGALVTFITYMGQLMATVDIIMTLRFLSKRIAPNVQSLTAFFELEEEKGGTSPMPDVIESIRFEHVTVSANGTDILKDICFQIQRGETVVIAGDNGSGKSTLFRALLRLTDLAQGEIYVNDVPIQAYDIEAYRRRFNVVMQDVHLFDGSILDNVCIAERASGQQKVKDVAFCTDFIRHRENGWQAAVGAQGAKLSGGEKQKIAFLRALNRDADVLLLDEPTASYDRESEQAFHAYLGRQKTFGICMMISHRSNQQDGFHRVLKLDHGQLIADSL